MKTTLLTIAIGLLPILCLVGAQIDLSELEIPDIDDFTAIKEKCDRLGGNGTYENVKKAQARIQTCLQGFIDVTVLKNEVEEAKKTGSMDEVFGKYCAKRPKVAECVSNFTNTVKACLDEEEKKALKLTLDILKQLGEFVCFRDGDRIAMFVAEGGVECIKNHTEGIKTCINSTFKIDTNINTNTLPNLLMDAKKCNDLGKLQNCTVTELEKCKDSTPANIVDALFKFIKRSACTEKTKRSIHTLWKRATEYTQHFTDGSDNHNVFKLEQLLKDNCKQNGPENAYENIMSELGKARGCMRSKQRSWRLMDTPQTDVKKGFQECTVDLLTKTSECLPENAKYFPKFLEDILFSIIDYTYAKKNTLQSSAMRTEIMDCLHNLREESAKNDFHRCVKDIDDFNSLEKPAVCNAIRKVENCQAKQFNKLCRKDRTLIELKNGLFDVILAHCDK